MVSKVREVSILLTGEESCPLCGGENHCGLVKGEKECWCMTVNFPEKVLKVAQKESDKCICQTCLDTYKEKYKH